MKLPNQIQGPTSLEAMAREAERVKESDRAYRGIKIARYTMKRKKNKDRLEMYVHQFDGEKNDASGEINCGHIQNYK